MNRNPWWSRIEPAERRAVGWATAWFFLLLLSYYVVRPVRETMGTIGGASELANMFLYSFLAMLVAVPLYSALVARIPRRWLVRVVFHFFAACLVGFFLLMHSESPTVQRWTARAFFVWVSVFGVFSTSLFWSVQADLFSSTQGRRLFGLIAAGGTSGAIIGSLITSQLATRLSTAALLLIPVVILEAGVWCAGRLERSVSETGGTAGAGRLANGTATGGGVLTGFTHVFRSPYLASICLFILFLKLAATQLYFEQAEIVRQTIADPQQRVELFAYLDLGTQLLTLILQVFVAGLVLRRLGVPVALVILPLVYAAGFIGLTMLPTLGVLIAAMIATRAISYGITVPAREVLFTVVSREDKYKSKSFIDTVVVRGGDVVSGQIFGALRGSLSFGWAALNVGVLPILAIWSITAWRLGAVAQRAEPETGAGPP